jgi:T-complex protein 1 subunit theta
MFCRFAQALEVIPRVLAENSGVKPKEVISKLYAAHSEGNKNIGFDIEGESGDVKVRVSQSLCVSYFKI